MEEHEVNEEKNEEDINLELPFLDSANGSAISTSYHKSSGDGEIDLKVTVIGTIYDDINEVHRIHKDIMSGFDLSKECSCKKVFRDVNVR